MVALNHRLPTMYQYGLLGGSSWLPWFALCEVIPQCWLKADLWLKAENLRESIIIWGKKF
jgi:hypothetical protein